MRKTLKLLLTVAIIASLCIQTVFASQVPGFITLYGRTNSSSEYVGVLVLNKSASLNTVKDTDIAYIDQAEIKLDGTFKISLPFFSNEDYNIHSNMNFGIYDGENKDTVYVSSTGSDYNDGNTAQTAFATLKSAYNEIFRVGEIVLLSDATYAETPEHSGNVTIKGESSSFKLTLPSEISLKGDLTLDNLTLSGASTIYANGYNFKISETVTSDARLTVYGGKKSSGLTGDTNITLLGGKYNNIYGGCNGGVVTGNTNVILGGNANPGDSNSDDESKPTSPCYVYGGSYNAAVTGKTNVTLEGNAVALYLVGAGAGANGTATDTNIFINGGKVMNVYGGSLHTDLTNCNTHITMTGGLAEALFGGCDRKNLTGNTYIKAMGGDVSRRIYTGCYNEWKLTYSSSNYVIGTTTLEIYPEIKLNTKTGLVGDNTDNTGVFSGSRLDAQSKEYNTLIFQNGSYSKHSDKIGDKSGYSLFLKSNADYTVKSTVNGKVQGTGKAGEIEIIPDKGAVAKVNNTTYKEATTISIGTGTTDVVFEVPAYNINSFTATKDASSVNASADIIGSATNTDPKLFIAVYEQDTNKMISCVFYDASSSWSDDVNIECNFEDGKKYIVKAMLLDGKSKPLSTSYSIELK